MAASAAGAAPGEDSQGGNGGFGGGGGTGFQIVTAGRGQAGEGGFSGDGGDGKMETARAAAAPAWAARSSGASRRSRSSTARLRRTPPGRARQGPNAASNSCGPGATDGRGAGGAIFTFGGDLVVRSSTFADNATQTVTNGGGGAIVVYDPDGAHEATLLLRNTILAGNGRAECYTRNGVDTGGSDGNIVTDSSPTNVHGDVNVPGRGRLGRPGARCPRP